MSSFNFQSIQSLEISAKDNPTIDVRDGRLILTAERDQERIMITAPLQGIMPKAAVTTVKMPKVKKSHPTRQSLLRQGGKNGMSKLNEEAVREIRSLLADQSFTDSYKSTAALYKELSKTYNVSVWTIKNVSENLSWKHVTI